MKDGFRSSLVGFVGGVALGLLLMLSAKWYGEQYLGKKMDAYFLGLLGILGACVGWLVRYAVFSVRKAIEGKADKDYVDTHLHSMKENIEISRKYDYDYKEEVKCQLTSIQAGQDHINDRITKLNDDTIELMRGVYSAIENIKLDK
jgi:hypothetical protein